MVGGQQSWDKYCQVGKFQWKMPEIAGMANTPKITEVAILAFMNKMKLKHVKLTLTRNFILQKK